MNSFPSVPRFPISSSFSKTIPLRIFLCYSTSKLTNESLGQGRSARRGVRSIPRQSIYRGLAVDVEYCRSLILDLSAGTTQGQPDSRRANELNSDETDK